MAAIRPTRLRAQKDLLPREVHTIPKHLKTHLKPLWHFLQAIWLPSTPDQMFVSSVLGGLFLSGLYIAAAWWW